MAAGCEQLSETQRLLHEAGTGARQGCQLHSIVLRCALCSEMCLYMRTRSIEPGMFKVATWLYSINLSIARLVAVERCVLGTFSSSAQSTLLLQG